MNSFPEDDSELVELAISCFMKCVLDNNLTPGRRTNIRKSLIDVIKHTGVSDKDIRGIIAYRKRMFSQSAQTPSSTGFHIPNTN